MEMSKELIKFGEFNPRNARLLYVINLIDVIQHCKRRNKALHDHLMIKKSQQIISKCQRKHNVMTFLQDNIIKNINYIWKFFLLMENPYVIICLETISDRIVGLC